MNWSGRLPSSGQLKNYLRRYGLKMLLYFAGTFVSCAGLAIVTVNALGSNAMNTLFTAVAVRLGVPSGNVYTVFNSTFLVVGFLLARRYMGVASFLMLVCQGPFINGWMAFFTAHPALFSGFWPKAGMALLGLVCSGVGGGLSTSVRLGTAGFEACLFNLADRIKVEYKYLKMISEVFYFTAALFLGGVYGVMTVVEIVAYGPVLSFFIIRYDRTLLKRLGLSDERNELYRNNRRYIRRMQAEQEALKEDALSTQEPASDESEPVSDASAASQSSPCGQPGTDLQRP